MTDTQGSGAGEGQVGDAAASVKEGNVENWEQIVKK